MGTRHLITIRINGKLKLAQYGQWDGYPSGCGKEIARFLQKLDDEKMAQFRANVTDCKWARKKRLDDVWIIFESGKAPLPPEYSRDTSYMILSLILERPRYLVNNNAFRRDKIFCEWIYDIDLDSSIIRVSCNGSKKWTFPLSEFSEASCEKIESGGK